MKLRKGTIHKAINPDSGRVISVKGAKEKAWAATSRYVRVLEPNCITCPDRTTEAGHYRHNTDKTNKKLGGNALWYDLRNIHGQCGTCNRYYSGRLDVYGLKLQAKYGMGILQELDRLYQLERKWTIPELLALEKERDAMTQKLLRDGSRYSPDLPEYEIT
jgi:hypothetical protein